jgi:hypothetical protein
MVAVACGAGEHAANGPGAVIWVAHQPGDEGCIIQTGDEAWQQAGSVGFTEVARKPTAH